MTITDSHKCQRHQLSASSVNTIVELDQETFHMHYASTLNNHMFLVVIDQWQM